MRPQLHKLMISLMHHLYVRNGNVIIFDKTWHFHKSMSCYFRGLTLMEPGLCGDRVRLFDDGDLAPIGTVFLTFTAA